MQLEREISVDIAKGLGIILVVFGHTIAAWGGEHEILHRFVYSFHMPLFFGLSGMYISYNSDVISFVKSRIIRFVIPFLSWALFYFLFYLALRILKVSLQGIVSVNEVKPIILDFQTLKNLGAIPFVANWATIKKAGVYIDLWFLPAIFSITILYQLLCNGMNRYRTVIILIVATLISYIIVFLNNRYGFHDSVPWSIDVALVCLPFLIICQYRSYAQRGHWIFIPFLILVIYYLSNNMNIEVAGLIIENYLKFIITATCGIALVFLVSVKLETSQIGKILSVVGKRTYLIFVLQGFVLTVFRPVLNRLPLLSTNETLFNCILFLTTLACGYAMYPFFDKYRWIRLFALGKIRK